MIRSANCLNEVRKQPAEQRLALEILSVKYNYAMWQRRASLEGANYP